MDLKSIVPSLLRGNTETFSGFFGPREQRVLSNLFLSPQVGFEPTTKRLTAVCSTSELPRMNFIWF